VGQRRQLLAILQLGDSALPVGRFAHSHGFEELLQRQPALQDQQLVGHLRHFLRFSVAPLDGSALLDAHAAAGQRSLRDVVDIDHDVTSCKITPASRISSTSSGRSLARLGRTLKPGGMTDLYAGAVEEGSADGNLAVAEGVVAADLGIESAEALLMELRGSAAACLGACVRLGRLGAVSAQGMLLQLHEFLYETADNLQALPNRNYSSTLPLFDVLGYAHGRNHSRIFAS
jgi:urease accessory protein